MKHGLLQVADTLHFLHSEAGLVHKGLCPSTILITQSGAACWGRCHAVSCEMKL